MGGMGTHGKEGRGGLIMDGGRVRRMTESSLAAWFGKLKVGIGRGRA